MGGGGNFLNKFSCVRMWVEVSA
uniref:Uncharacterized protein n=1 Tax=Anguilla anguilla TaxID=7936 RepID=A0A0E9XFY4_ANGAN